VSVDANHTDALRWSFAAKKDTKRRSVRCQKKKLGVVKVADGLKRALEIPKNKAPRVWVPARRRRENGKKATEEKAFTDKVTEVGLGGKQKTRGTIPRTGDKNRQKGLAACNEDGVCQEPTAGTTERQKKKHGEKPSTCERAGFLSMRTGLGPSSESRTRKKVPKDEREKERRKQRRKHERNLG